jgi:hypothetical protein
VLHGSQENDFSNSLDGTPFIGLQVDTGEVWRVKGKF